MKALQHIEVQRFSQVRWLWFALIALLVAELLILAPQLAHDQPLLLALSLVAFLLPMVLILFVLRYELKIDEGGIHYRFIPRVLHWKTLSYDQVASFEVREKKTFYEKFHMGYHHSIFTKTTTINISGNQYLVLTLRDGVLVKLGTSEGSALEYILKRKFTETSE